MLAVVLVKRFYLGLVMTDHLISDSIWFVDKLRLSDWQIVASVINPV